MRSLFCLGVVVAVIGGAGCWYDDPTLAKSAADPAATVARDIDGDARPQGAARDQGADEVLE